MQLENSNAIRLVQRTLVVGIGWHAEDINAREEVKVWPVPKHYLIGNRKCQHKAEAGFDFYVQKNFKI